MRLPFRTCARRSSASSLAASTPFSLKWAVVHASSSRIVQTFGGGVGGMSVRSRGMTVGPVISIGIGVPSGRLVDTWGAQRVRSLGLLTLAAGALALSTLPEMFGVVGYIAAIAVLTPGYQMFQSANNTMVMAEVPADQRGAVSGLLGLSRNIGLILGASAMGAIFSLGVGTSAIENAASGAIADGMRLTFMVAGASMVGALWFTRGSSNHIEQ